MDIKGIEELSKGIGETIKTVPELYHDGLQPAVQETGKTLALIPKTINAALSGLQQWIAYREYNVEEIKKLLALKLENVGADKIVPPEPYVAVPAIQAISYSMNSEELRNAYANLLAASMNADKKWDVHPSFVGIIQQLSPDEAKLLKSITEGLYPIIDLKIVRPDGTFNVIWRNYTDIADSICEHSDKVFSYLDNLERLKLIEISFGTYIADESVYKHLEEHADIKKFKEDVANNLKKDYKWECERKIFRLTQYGMDFIEICIKS